MPSQFNPQNNVPPVNNTPIQQNPVQTPKKKCFGLYFIIAIVLVVLASACLIWQSQKTGDNLDKQSVINVPSNLLSNWKTYTNEEYGFEFKYPDNLKFEIDYTAAKFGEFFATMKPSFPSYQSFNVSIKDKLPDLRDHGPDSPPYSEFQIKHNVSFGNGFLVTKEESARGDSYYLPLTFFKKFLVIIFNDDEFLVDVGETLPINEARPISQEIIQKFYDSVKIYSK
jgi:hypothetical protein